MRVTSIRWQGILAAVLLSAGIANADFIVNVEQVGSNVVATGSGSINTTGLTDEGFGPDFSPGVEPDEANLTLGVPHAHTFEYVSISGPSSFGSGGFVLASSDTGDFVALDESDSALLFAPTFVSGNPLSDSDTWDGTTLAGLGLTPGTYTWTWGTGVNADSFIVNIGTVATPEPEYPGVLLLVLGAMAASQRRRARRRI